MVKAKPQPTNQDIKTWLQHWDDYFLSLYHERNDPQKPPEYTDRISRYFRPTDLPYAR